MAPENGNVDLSHGGAVARFSCREGFLLKGAKSLTCDGANWNGTAPYCAGEDLQTKDINGKVTRKKSFILSSNRL